MREEPPKTITQVIDLPIFADPDPGRLEGERWDFTVGIVGSGGDGVITAGEIVESTLSKQGLYCMLVKSFGPQIRGGESYVQVRTSAAPLATEGDALDVLIVLSWKDLKRFESEVRLKGDALILYDPNDDSGGGLQGASQEHVQGRRVVEVAFGDLAKESSTAKNKNVVVLGVLSRLASMDAEALRDAVSTRFARKGESVVAGVRSAFDAGLQLSGEALGDAAVDLGFIDVQGDPKCVMTGNEAVAFGALYAGCRFFGGYPITPSTEIMEFMSRYLPRYGGRCVQAEDEISAIGMCVGASFSGVKAMTGTSGPGLSLMSEILGLASIAELPLVIANVQRVGPSTGIPTKSEQSDLLHAAFGGHGDAARVVIAPTDVEDCFDCTVKAFFIAERFQLPVIILSDQLIGQRKEAIEPEGIIHEVEGFIETNVRKTPEDLSNGFARYADTDDQIPHITSPGTPGGAYQISGLEHDAVGRPTSSYAHHEHMAERRRNKLERVRREFRFIRWYGPKEADVGVIAWGSSKGAVKEAVMRANARGVRAAALIPQVVYPVPMEHLQEFIAAMKRILVVELSANAQFLQLIHSAVSLPDDTLSYARPGANPLRIDEVGELIDGAAGIRPLPERARTIERTERW